MMKLNVNRIGNIAGVLGIAVCILSGIARLIGEPVFLLHGIQTINIYTVGIGLMVFGCFAKLSGR